MLAGGTPGRPRRSKSNRWKIWERSEYSLFIFVLMCSEWGDISQVIAIGLAAKYGIMSIIIGGGIAHIISIFIAIVIGSVVTKAISEKWMNLFAGLLFLAFTVREIYNFETG